MERDEQELDNIPAKFSTDRILKVRCWMCKKSLVSGTNERCEKCRLNSCLHCGEKLTKLRRLLEDDKPLGDTILVCTNPECGTSFRITKLKGIWKAVKDEDKNPEYVQ